MVLDAAAIEELLVSLLRGPVDAASARQLTVERAPERGGPGRVDGRPRHASPVR
jgi:hypothetical protein